MDDAKRKELEEWATKEIISAIVAEVRRQEALEAALKKLVEETPATDPVTELQCKLAFAKLSDRMKS